MTGGAASRDWLSLDTWSYQNGDSTAIAGNELNKLSRPVYDFIVRTKGVETDDYVSHPRAEVLRVNSEQLEALMCVFNTEVTNWGDTWGPIYATCEPPALKISTPSLFILG
jgi:hypothetical protein